MTFMKCTVLCFIIGFFSQGSAKGDGLYASISKVDISPRTFPALRNGGFLQAVASKIDDTLYSKCVVLSDGKEKIAIVVVDSCMIPTALCDTIKSQVSKITDLRPDRILISATHTHSAPSVMSFCLGTNRDEAYTKIFTQRIVEGIAEATKALVSVEVGWGSIDASELTSNRRWITRKDKMLSDPFGKKTVRAMMHPGYMNPDYVSESGPIDPELSLFAIREKKSGKLLCVFANYSMHYFSGNPGFSADYFGEASKILEHQLQQNGLIQKSRFLSAISQGTSGDLYWVDYSKPRVAQSRTEYSTKITKKISHILESMTYHSEVPLMMREKRISVGRRLPDKDRLEWAKVMNQKRGDVPPRNRPEVYAQAAQWIHDNPTAEVVLQAIRMGGLSISAMPNEVYAITGLKLKQGSPSEVTMNIELANGAEGYIPPPEQHLFGGYTTWPARTAGLAEKAEPRIVDELLQLLGEVNGRPQKNPDDIILRNRSGILSSQPFAYWPLDDLSASAVLDLTGNHSAKYEGPVALYLEGIHNEGISKDNKCVYFAGGFVDSKLLKEIDKFTLNLYFWSANAPVSRGSQDILLELKSDNKNTLKMELVPDKNANAALLLHIGMVSKKTEHTIPPRKWHQLSIQVEENTIKVYLNNQLRLSAQIQQEERKFNHISFGAFDGKMDEVILYEN